MELCKQWPNDWILKKEGIQITSFQDNKEIHCKPYLQIFWIIQGEVYFECNGKQIYAKQNQIVLINCNEIHFLKALNPKAIYYQISIQPSLLGKAPFDVCLDKYLTPMEENRMVFQNLLHPDEKLQQLLVELMEEYQEQKTGYELALKGMLYSLIVILIRDHVCTECSNREATCLFNCRKKFLPVFTYIEEHYTEKIQVNDMAGLIEVTPCHFCRTFKQISKKTLIDYVNTVRLSKACDLLIETQDAIREVSMRCGFEDMNYFIRIFKKYYRMTPNQFRKIWNEKKEGQNEHDRI